MLRPANDFCDRKTRASIFLKHVQLEKALSSQVQIRN